MTDKIGPLKYAPMEFVKKLNDLEQSEPSTIKNYQAPTEKDFNGVFSSFPYEKLTNSIITEIQPISDEFLSTYKYGAVTVLPSINSMNMNNVHVGCKTAAEYSNEAPVKNMKRVDDGYHLLTSCKNKAIMQNKKYYSLVRPLPASGMSDSMFMECHVGDDPIPTESNIYNYVPIWSMGPAVKTFGLSDMNGDILITADNISILGVKQLANPTVTTNYIYGDSKTFVPLSFVSMLVSVFDLNQVGIVSGFMNGGSIGKQLPISQAALMNGTNDKYIVACKDAEYTKMILVNFAVINSVLNVKVLEAKNSVAPDYGGPFRYFKITAKGRVELQISEVQIFDDKGNNIAKGKTTSASSIWPETRVKTSNAVSGVAKMKPYYNGYHSYVEPNNSSAWWMVDLGADSVVSKVVYYNRLDCCQSRISGAVLQGFSSDKEELFNTKMDAGNVQTFFINRSNSKLPSKSNNTSGSTLNTILNPSSGKNTSAEELNNLWNAGTPQPIVANATTAGYGLQGLTIAVSPFGLGRGPSGYVSKSNTSVADGASPLYTITDIPASNCQMTCDNDQDCLGYTVYEDTTKTKTVEGPSDNLGCFADSGARAMPNFQGGVTQVSDCLKKAIDANHMYYGLQYYGECWTTNDSVQSSRNPNIGYDRYGRRDGCGTLGGYWANNVFQRKTINIPTSTCNFYGNDINNMKNNVPGTNTFIRNKTGPKVSNDNTLNLTNNITKYDLGGCNDNTCKFRIELGDDGNIKVYRLMTSSGTTPTALTPGDVMWDLFSYDPSVKDKLKTIVPIDNMDWKKEAMNVSNSTLYKGENIPSKDKKYLLSPSGRFKLEIHNGYLQLKATVYGCFGIGNSYDYGDSIQTPMYTPAVQNAPQSYYLYQADLSHPKPGTTYYTIAGPNGTAMRPFPKDSKLLLNDPNATYTQLVSPLGTNIYLPLNDVDKTPISTDLNGCQTKCNEMPECNYIYTNNKNECKLGNQYQPAYVPNPKLDGGYNLYIKNKVLDITDVSLNQTGGITDLYFNQTVQAQTVSELPKYNYLGPELKPFSNAATLNKVGELYDTSPYKIGPKNTIPGLSIADHVDDLINGRPGKTYTNQSTVSNTTTSTINNNTTTNSNNGSIQTWTSQNNQTSVQPNLLQVAASQAFDIAGFRNREGFDTHNYNDPGSRCGVDGNPPCQPGVLFGQIKPLQKIAQDYSTAANTISNKYRDLSNNIGEYNAKYNVVDSDPKYDFKGDQPIVLKDNSNLQSRMQDDAKLLALQTNNMYIAGSILTTTLLISAIYLGRS